MKKIAFGDLDFNIVNSYKSMKSIIDGRERVLLFNEFWAKPMLCKELFRSHIDFEIEDVSNEALTRVERILTERYGEIDFITNTSYYIRKEIGFYITHSVYETYFQDTTVHLLRVTFYKPYSFMWPYKKLHLYVQAVDRIKEKWGLEYSFSSVPIVESITNGNAILYLSTERFQYMISFTDRKFGFYSSTVTKTGNNLINEKPFYHQKGKHRGVDDLYIKLDSFFTYLEEYDEGLKKSY